MIWKPSDTAHSRARRLVLAFAAALCSAQPVHADNARTSPALAAADGLRGGVTLEQILAIAVARSPELRGARERVAAVRHNADAEAALPPPDLSLDVWQVPLADPARIDRAGMVMVAVRQEIPAPGSLGQRATARREEANKQVADVEASSHLLVREVSHAFVDYAIAHELHAVHDAHLATLRQSVEIARTRLTTGGPLSDVALSDAAVALAEADRASERTRIDAARIRLNVLMGRSPGARLGRPAWQPPERTVTPAPTLIAAAEARRPELRAAAAERRAREAEAGAAATEARVPAFAVSASYFAPTDEMPRHGYGFGASMTVPWLWGPARSRHRAAEASARAARNDIDAQRLGIRQQVATSLTQLSSSSERLRVLDSSARPAGRRAVEATRAAYVTGGSSLGALLEAARSAVEIELEIVSARSELAHATIDLDWALGSSRLPTGKATSR
jgi:cobalt-zinc-cadmium efflux system outer membrane protein